MTASRVVVQRLDRTVQERRELLRDRKVRRGQGAGVVLSGMGAAGGDQPQVSIQNGSACCQVTVSPGNRIRSYASANGIQVATMLFKYCSPVLSLR